MKLSYQIMPFKTEEKRKEVIFKLLSQAAYIRNLNERDKHLLKYRDEKTVDEEITLKQEFEDQLNHPYFKGYKECVEFYLNPIDVSAGRPLDGDLPIFEINWGSKSSYAKGHMGGAQLFIALNLDKYNIKNKKGVFEVLKGTKDDVSALNILNDTDSDVLRLISTMVKSGSKRRNKTKKRKKTKKRSKTKVQKNKKKIKQKKK